MKLPVYGLTGEAVGEITVARAFSAAVRPDLIRKAVLAEQSERRQPYGTDPLAGQRSSAYYRGRRSARWAMMNKEMARMKRITNQGYLNYTARIVPQAVKGRKAHPPKAEKSWAQKINKKERQKAMASAIAASAQEDMVRRRGHRIDTVRGLPLILEDALHELKKNKDVVKALRTLGLEAELGRVKEKGIRPGAGTRRGRKYRRKKGPLIIVHRDQGIIKASQNIAGVDAVLVADLSVELLAPGAAPGRLCVWTKSALESVENSAT